MRTSIGIRIAAPPRRVFELARDVGQWPELLPHYRRVTIRYRSGDRVLAQMVALRPFGPFAVPVTWRAVCWADDLDPTDLRLRFRHVRGVTAGMEVTWHIRPIGGVEVAGAEVGGSGPGGVVMIETGGGPVPGRQVAIETGGTIGPGSEVTIEHDFRRSLPLLSALLGPDALPRFVDRAFTRPIAGRTLSAFRAHAEAGPCRVCPARSAANYPQ